MDLGGIGAYAQRFGGPAVGLGIVDEERAGRIGPRLSQHLPEDGHIGLGQLHPVGKEDAVEEVVHPMAVTGEGMAERPLPVDVVGVAQQIDLVAAAELQQQVELILRNAHQETVPGIVYLGVGHGDARHLPDVVAKLRIGNQSLLVEQEEALLVAHVEHGLHVGNAQRVEAVEASLTVEVDEHTAKVYNQRIYSL